MVNHPRGGSYLYTSGYCPSLQVWMDAWEEELPVEEAVSDYREFFAGYTAVTAEIEELIRSYVHDRAVNGIFRESFRVRFGALLWMVGERFGWVTEPDAEDGGTATTPVK